MGAARGATAVLVLKTPVPPAGQSGAGSMCDVTRPGWSALRPTARLVVAAFAVSGTAHLVRPALFRPLIPPLLPGPQAWVVATGVAELACAVGLVRGSRWAPGATAATLIAVWPGNWYHALTTQRSSAPTALKVTLWLRLPLQVPMVRAALDPYAGEAA